MGTGAKRVEVLGVEQLAERASVTALALGGISVGGRKAGVAASVRVSFPNGVADQGVADTLMMGVSKLDSESEWIVDSLGPDGGCPFYANGVGSRCTKLKAVKDDAIIAALDAAADGLGGHDCQENAVPYVSDGALGHGWECGVCGRFLQAG